MPRLVQAGHGKLGVAFYGPGEDDPFPGEDQRGLPFQDIFVDEAAASVQAQALCSGVQILRDLGGGNSAPESVVITVADGFS